MFTVRHPAVEGASETVEHSGILNFGTEASWFMVVQGGPPTIVINYSWS